MAQVRTDDELVTDFLLNTCAVRQWVNLEALLALRQCAGLASKRDIDNDECEVIAVTTGSLAEFYIQLMLSCVGDVDTMYHFSDELAIPSGTAPPTQLPDEFHSRVKVYEIVDSEFPGYVYLVSSYLLTECIDDGKYNAVEGQREYWSYEVDEESHGPAKLYDVDLSIGHRVSGTLCSQDTVSYTHLTLPTKRIV